MSPYGTACLTGSATRLVNLLLQGPGSVCTAHCTLSQTDGVKGRGEALWLSLPAYRATPEVCLPRYAWQQRCSRSPGHLALLSWSSPHVHSNACSVAPASSRASEMHLPGYPLSPCRPWVAARRPRPLPAVRSDDFSLSTMRNGAQAVRRGGHERTGTVGKSGQSMGLEPLSLLSLIPLKKLTVLPP